MKEQENSRGEQLRKALSYTKKNGYDRVDRAELEAMDAYCTGYKQFLDAGKTERECVTEIVRQAEAAGYRDLYSMDAVKAGDKVYATWMEKSIALFHVGSEPLEQGMNILGAHIDSPRLDLKQNPLYEDSGFAYFDTHYYGGIKKYQWVTIPLGIHGVIVRKDGTKEVVSIGEKEEDPVFAVTDLLVHLSSKQMEKKASAVVEGENLDILIGSRPLAGEEKEAVAAQIMKLLADTYHIEREDLMSAELEVVPAGKARDCGLDRSMVIGYGQDDRVCAFTSLFAMLETENPERTSCCILVDKEEIGSVGATGMHSRFFEDYVAELMALTEDGNPLKVRRALRNSYMLSSDVSAAFDPLYADAFEKKNTAYFGRGLVFNKFTGSRGKNNSNDANAEYIAKVRQVLDNNEVGFQTAEMGRVDLGGGGTIAYIMANYGMNVIDSGVAVLSMHAPYEVTSKADIYEAYRGYKAFLKDIK